VQRQQQQPQQLDIGATFTTTRTRPTVVAVITTLLFLVLAVHDYNYRDYPAGEVLVNLVCLVLLIPAVRAWLCVVRRPVELRLTPAELTIHRGDRELSLPWDAIGQIRIEGDLRRPWVVAWLHPTQDRTEVPASRRRDGAYKLFPIGHGQSVKKRGQKVGELRAAIMGYGRRYLDPGF
jgi:hypothetical protein